MNKKAKKFDYVLAVIFVFLVIITIYPFLNVLAISFNDSTDTIKNVNFIIPRKFTLSNYKYVFKDGGIAMPAVISVTRTIIGTIVGIVCTSMVAYTLSRRDLNTDFKSLCRSGAKPMLHGFIISLLVVLVAIAVEFAIGIAPHGVL